MRPERYYHPSVGYYEHMPACRVRDYVGEEVWRSYFKFAFDRNPWDRQVSWYLYKTKSKRRAAELRALHEEPPPRLREQLRASTRIDGALAVDFVGRYESLEDDLNKVLKQIGVKRRLEVPHTNVTPNKDESRGYRTLYTDRTRAIVETWYQPEIALLGYGF